MDDYESLKHTKWECKYHVVFTPKCRRKTLRGRLRKHLGAVFRQLAMQKESEILEGHLGHGSRPYAGLDEYIRRQEEEDRRQDQMKMFA